MHNLTCGISSLVHSVNLIVFTLLLAHLILRISPHHSHHLHSHHLPLPPPRACLDQHLIAIRLREVLGDHVRSKTPPIDRSAAL